MGLLARLMNDPAERLKLERRKAVLIALDDNGPPPEWYGREDRYREALLEIQKISVQCEVLNICEKALRGED